MISICVLGVGLGAVFVEVESVRTGIRVRQLQVEESERRERVRRLQLRYNRLLSPDVLLRQLPMEFEPPAAEDVELAGAGSRRGSAIERAPR